MAQSSLAIRSREVRAALRRAGLGDLRVNVQSPTSTSSVVFIAGALERAERHTIAGDVADRLGLLGIDAEVDGPDPYPFVRVRGDLS